MERCVAGALLRFERLVEGVLENVVGRAVRLKVQPIDIAKRLARVMEAEESVSVSGKIAPNAYRVQLNPQDLEDMGGAVDSLEREFVTYLTEIAAEREITFRAAPVVKLTDAAEVGRGTFRVHPYFSQSSESAASPSPVVAPDNPTPRALVPIASVPSLQLTASDGSGWAIPTGETFVGRGLDNGIVIEDPHVSRQHARISYDGRSCELTDLDSSNGTFVNGRRVRKASLKPGDRVAFGAFETWVRTAP
jgi:hypothetical protein